MTMQISGISAYSFFVVEQNNIQNASNNMNRNPEAEIVQQIFV